MLGDVARAFGELRHRAFWGVAAAAVGLALALLGLGFWGLGAWLGVGEGGALTLPLLGEVRVAGEVGAALWLVLALALSALLMAPVAALVAGLMLEAIVAAVERRAWPHLPPGRPASLGQQLRAAVGLAATLVVANLLALGVYLIAAPLAPLAFALVNGWLIGREYFELVALRRMGLAEARALRRRHRLSVLGLGALVAAALPLPLANLFAPLLGVAAMTHMVHRLSGGVTRP